MHLASLKLTKTLICLLSLVVFKQSQLFFAHALVEAKLMSTTDIQIILRWSLAF